MTWTTPPTFVDATDLPASDLNILGDDLVYLKGITDSVSASGVQVTRVGTQSVSTSTSTTVTFTAEVFDLGSWYSTGTDITVPAGAIPGGYTTIIVDIDAECRFASNATGARAMTIYLNGAAVDPGRRFAAVGGGDSTDIGMSRKISVAAGDVITLRVYQNSGSSLNVSNVVMSVMRYAPEA